MKKNKTQKDKLNNFKEEVIQKPQTIKGGVTTPRGTKVTVSDPIN